MTLTIHNDLEQGSDEWLQARCGILTASVIGQLITKAAPDPTEATCPTCNAEPGGPCTSTARKSPTPIKTIHGDRRDVASGMEPTLTVATGDVATGLIASLVAERITGHVEPVFPNRDMERGTLDEPYARDFYREHHRPVQECGFMVRDIGGKRIGYSPDGLVGAFGLIEIKSRKQKKQLQTILADEVPAENMAQIQCGLLVSGRRWLDYISYSGGMPLYVKRVYPDIEWLKAIVKAAEVFEQQASTMMSAYAKATENQPLTPRIDHFADLEI